MTGLSATSVERNFEGCQAVAQVSNQWGILNEETREHPSVFVCRGPRKPWPVFWNKFRYFG